jgi:hypothetical protein
MAMTDFCFVSLRDELILKAGGGPQRLSFLCLPKEKKAKERAPCYRLIAARLADHGAKRTRR